MELQSNSRIDDADTDPILVDLVLAIAAVIVMVISFAGVAWPSTYQAVQLDDKGNGSIVDYGLSHDDCAQLAERRWNVICEKE